MKAFPQLTRFFLTGPLDQLHGKTPELEAKEALHVVADIARCVHNTGCANYEIRIGFWVPTKTWRLHLKTVDHVLPGPDQKGLKDIREKVSAYVHVDQIREQSTQNATASVWWWDWARLGGEWCHVTSLVVQNGIPIIRMKDGEDSGESLHDRCSLGFREEHLGQLTQTGSALNTTVDLDHVLEKLTCSDKTAPE
ncbi:hypothetical protein BJX61DRAFT_490847 [Aspergillus egyptiacus]|nr:hypothetical protein BJX61DRAFT_490847 [Aspergillus egyptiacus]